MRNVVRAFKPSPRPYLENWVSDIGGDGDRELGTEIRALVDAQ